MNSHKLPRTSKNPSRSSQSSWSLPSCNTGLGTPAKLSHLRGWRLLFPQGGPSFPSDLSSGCHFLNILSEADPPSTSTSPHHMTKFCSAFVPISLIGSQRYCIQLLTTCVSHSGPRSSTSASFKPSTLRRPLLEADFLSHKGPLWAVPRPLFLCSGTFGGSSPLQSLTEC